MADAVYGLCLPNSQSGADVRSDAEADHDIEAALLRFENNRKSAQSAAAIFVNAGSALVDQIKTIKTNSVAPRPGEAASRLRAAAKSLDEIANFVHCAWRAAKRIKDQDDRDGLSSVLGHVLVEMDRLSKELKPGAEA